MAKVVDAAHVSTRTRKPRRFRWWLFWCVVLAPWLLLLYELAVLSPMWVNYDKVTRSLEEVAAGYHDGEDPESLARGVAEHFKKAGVRKPPEAGDIRVSSDGSQWLLEASYDDQAPLFPGLTVVVSFHKMVRTAPRAAGP